MPSKINLFYIKHFLLFYRFDSFKRLYKTYENLDAGQTYDALVDMTGKVI
jgi:hypothetical protein